MARVLAVSSQVARGAIGLSAAVPALQALGHEVIALPTILLSNHPGHTRFAGERVSARLLELMLNALDENGWLTRIDGILTGYLPSAEHVAFAVAAVEQVKRRSPSALYVCDPVLGDHPKGVYIAPDAADAIRDTLVPKADVLKMNRFEAAWLSGAEIGSGDDVVSATTGKRWPTAIVTSLPSRDETKLANLLVDEGAAAACIEVTRRGRVPNGTGDLFGALWLGHRLLRCSHVQALERAVAGVEWVLSRSEMADELQLVAAFKDIAP